MSTAEEEFRSACDSVIEQLGHRRMLEILSETVDTNGPINSHQRCQDSCLTCDLRSILGHPVFIVHGNENVAISIVQDWLGRARKSGSSEARLLIELNHRGWIQNWQDDPVNTPVIPE